MIGEHIRALKEGRWDHAIDCGDETVIHLGDDRDAPRVRRSYRPAFVEGAATVQLVTERALTFPPQEVVARAYSRLADPALAAMFRDSQAFAEWCTTGRTRAPLRNVAARVAGELSAAAQGRGAAKRKARGGPKPARARKAARARPAAKRRKARASGGRTAKRPAPRAGTRAPPPKRTGAKRGARRGPSRRG
jgi:hypothetical protein